jgi:hypothetical protein
MKQLLVRLCSLAMVFGCGPMLAGVVLSVEPPYQAVADGSAVSVSLQISGLGAFTAPSLGTFDLDLRFDPSLLDFNSFVFGDPVLGDQLDLSGFGSITGMGTTPGSGVVNIYEVSLDLVSDLDNLQEPMFTLGILEFQPLQVGISFLFIDINALGDASGDSLPESVTVRAGVISITPEPGSITLVAATLIALVLGGRRRCR